MSKDAVEGAVEDKVARRVDGQQKVGDLADGLDQVPFVRVAEAEERRHDRVRRDADDEDEDDGDEHEGDALTTSHRTPPLFAADGPTSASQRPDDETIQNAEDRERNDRTQHVVQPRVDNDEVLIRPKIGQLKQKCRIFLNNIREPRLPILFMTTVLS